MIVREVSTISEIVAVAEFMTQFEKATSFVKVNVAHTSAAYERMISAGTAVFLVLEESGKMRGGLGAIKYPDLHDGRMTAVETFWFVAPEFRGQGIKLFDAFEAWSLKNGCEKLAMVHLADSYPDALKRLYLRRGYSLVEEHYVKEV